MEDWPARQRWQDPGYLKAVAGSRTVPVEVGQHYLAPGWGQRLMSLADFVDERLLRPDDGEVCFLSHLPLYSCHRGGS